MKSKLLATFLRFLSVLFLDSTVLESDSVHRQPDWRRSGFSLRSAVKAGFIGWRARSSTLAQILLTIKL